MIKKILYLIFAALLAQRTIRRDPITKGLPYPSDAVCLKELRHLLRIGGCAILVCRKLLAPMGIRNSRHKMSWILLRFNRIPKLKLVKQMPGSNPAFHQNGGFFLTQPNKGPEHELDEDLEWGDLFEFNKSLFGGRPIFHYASLGKNTPILKIVIHPSGKLVFMGCYDITGRYSLICYNFVADYTDVRHTILHGHRDSVYAIAIHSDGRFMVSASSDRRGIVWNIPAPEDCSGISKITHIDFGMCVFSIEFHPKNHLFAAGGQSNDIKLFKLAPNGHVVGVSTLIGHGNYVYDVKFLEEGTRIASASADNLIMFWDINSRTCLKRINAHRDSVRDLWFDSRQLVMVSISFDNTIKVWSISGPNATLIQNLPINGHRYDIKEIVSDLSEAQLVSAGSDQLNVYCWELP